MSKAIAADSIEARSSTTYPAEFRQEVAGRYSRALGDRFELSNFGVNLIDLQPGAWSAQRHWHTREDEFVYVVAGELTLVTDDNKQVLTPGMCVGFAAGVENGHHLVNESDKPASFLVVGDRQADDECHYPDVDLFLRYDGKGPRVFTDKTGKPYDT